jgi:hypothetical protein
MECIEVFYYNDFRYSENKMNKSGKHYILRVEAHVYLFLPRHYEYPRYRIKLIKLYSISSFYAWILR